MTETQIQQLASILDQLAVLVLPLALSWAAAHWGLKQRAEATLARNDLVGALARTAVKGAEQQFGGKAGAKKREWAIDWLAHEAARYGLTIGDAQKEQIGGAIEAAVRDLHTGDEVRASVAKPAAGVTAVAGQGQEASASVQPAPQEMGITVTPPSGPQAVMTPFTPAPSQQSDVTITTTTNDPTASKPIGAGTGVSS